MAKLAVETKLARLAVLIKPNPPRLAALERYPAVPKPITVLVKLAVVRAPMIFVAWIEET